VDFLDKVLAKGFQESVEDVDELLREKRKLVKMLVITLPFILEDNALAQIKLTSNLKQIESQFNSRMVQGKQEQRSLAILYLIPKLPYNVSSME
jgi:hypothetical protein